MKLPEDIKLKKQSYPIKLSDKFLIAIMILLMVESLLSIFLYQQYTPSIEKIDVVLRSIMTSIFGYFISVNFIRWHNDNNAQVVSKEIKICGPNGEILPDGNENIECQEMKIQVFDDSQKNHSQKLRSKPQVTVVGILCAISVIFLIIIKYSAEDNNITQATINLFRGFSCSSIGFLIGMPAEQIKN